MPSAGLVALGKDPKFAECLDNYTRQICYPVNRKMVALPSVRLKAARPLIRVLVINDNSLWINDFI